MIINDFHLGFSLASFIRQAISLCVRVGWGTYACGAAVALRPSSGTAIFSSIRPAQRSSLRTFSNLSRMASRGSSVSRLSALSLLLLSSSFVFYFLVI